MNVEQIKRDITCFADPGTPVVVNNRRVAWTQNHQDMVATFRVDGSEYPPLRFQGRDYNYPEFLASPHMADLLALAQSIPTYLDSLPGQVDDFVVPRVIIEGSSNPGLAEEVLGTLARPTGEADSTTVLFLRGRAGDGKSALLTHLARKAADNYAKGDQAWLYLYIDAQGRALSRIDEAIALILQDLRSKFTYHAVAALTRLGLLIPVVDGFDELLGVGGYRDAFSSLGQFISRLNSSGSLVASARSSFYHSSAFGEHASRFSPEAFRVVPVDLLPWETPEVTQYLDIRDLASTLKLDSADQAVARLRQLVGTRADEVFSSPFLLSKLVNFVQVGRGSIPAHINVGVLVEDLLQREVTEKLKDKQGAPLLSLAGHVLLLSAFAEEMWWQETRALDADSFRTIAELTCEQLRLPHDVAEIVIERMSTHALVSTVERPRGFAFRHELYFAHFLANTLLGTAAGDGDVSSFLARSALPVAVADEFVGAWLQTNGPEQLAVLDKVLLPTRGANTAETIRLNRGALIAAFVRGAGPRLSGRVLERATFDASDFRDTEVSAVTIRTCEFRRPDLRGAVWRKVVIEDCVFLGTRVSNSTRLDVEGTTLATAFVGLSLFSEDRSVEDVFEPSEVAALLGELGCAACSSAAEEGQALSPRAKAFEKRLHAFLRVVQSTLVFSDDDFRLRGASMKNDYQDVVDALTSHGLLVKTERGISGQRQLFKLTASADRIKTGQASGSANQAIAALWRDVRAM